MTARGLRRLSFLALGVLILAAFAWLALANGWSGHLQAWLNLLVRWAHVIIGIAWIGASFYFVFLENSLERENVRDELAGNLWAVHGGGFYYVEKYKVAPEKLPERLHWFKWEAYLTWITGFFLLAIVYYADAELVMVDPERPIAPWLAVAIGLATLALGWFVYDRMCRSPLVRRTGAFAAVGFALVVLLAFGLSELLSGRAAYMHVGAMLGTLMAGNVFFVIIPSQKAMVRAAERGEPLDPELGRHAGLRSLHNNYMTLPVVFVMISNHFPMTYGHPASWAVLAGLFLASVAIRHYLNLRERGRDAALLLPTAALAAFVLAYVTAPPSAAGAAAGAVPSFAEVREVVEARCVACHAAAPTDDVFTSAPAGVRLDTDALIAAQAERIHQRSVVTRDMPFGNKTGMTEEERDLIARWHAHGAPTE